MTMKVNMMGRSLTTLSVAIAMATLGGCGRGDTPREDPIANESLESPITGDNLSTVPPPPETPANVAEAAPPPAPLSDPSEEAQMRDDADATGLTSRMNQTEEAPVGGNETGLQNKGL